MEGPPSRPPRPTETDPVLSEPPSSERRGELVPETADYNPGNLRRCVFTHGHRRSSESQNRVPDAVWTAVLKPPGGFGGRTTRDEEKETVSLILDPEGNIHKLKQKTLRTGKRFDPNASSEPPDQILTFSADLRLWISIPKAGMMRYGTVTTERTSPQI